MNADPKVTVLMPAFNTGKYIGEAISSVLAQTFTDFELLVINDGSTDDTEQVIKRFKDPRIILVNRTHEGIAGALNLGLSIARGKYIARFDSDDICNPERLQIQYDFMINHPDHVLTGSEAEYIDTNGEHVYNYHALAHDHEGISKLIMHQCPFIHSSVFFVTEIARMLGGYDTGAHTFEDHLLWTRFIKHGRVANLPATLIRVRLNPGSVTIDEKLRGARFNALKRNILISEKPVTDEDGKELSKILNGQNLNGYKTYSYHILVAKKYLWNNYQPAKARNRLWKAIGFRPFKPIGYGLLILSCLPKKMVSNFYKNYKQLEHNG